MFECKVDTFCNALQKTIFGMQNFVMPNKVLQRGAQPSGCASARSVVDCAVLFFM